MYKLILTVTLVAVSLLPGRGVSPADRVYDPHSVDIPAFVVTAETAPQKISFLVSNLQKRPTKIWLEDDQGKILFKATVCNRNSYGRIFDMSRLAKGTYHLIIEQARNQRIVEPIHLSTSK